MPLRRLLFLVALLSSVLAQTTAQAADLTALETRWLKGVWPVLSYARESLAMPVDIVVQPQDAPGAAPMALGFADGRCKLVLSMRGNPEGQRQLDAMDPALTDAALELMAAHELAHCHRYLQGAWHGLPTGFVAAKVPEGLSPELQQAWRDMRSTRREEGYADLVGLAWTRERHPALYARLHAWLVTERSVDLLPGSHHDTLEWLALVQDPAQLNGSSMFDVASDLWVRGLKE